MNQFTQKELDLIVQALSRQFMDIRELLERLTKKPNAKGAANADNVADV